MEASGRPHLPSLPHSWSELSWQQLCLCWQAKIRYGGNPDVARVAAMLALLGLSVRRHRASAKPVITSSGETPYRLHGKDGCLWAVTPREAAQMARQALPWFDYPYGDPGEKEEKDEKGKVVKERREAVAGYVSPMRDALALPITELRVGRRFAAGRWFALPQVACNNLTWQQYRTLQAIAPQLLDEDADTTELQAQFLAHCLVPRSAAVLDTAGGSIRLRPHYEYRYNSEQAEMMAHWFRRKLEREDRAGMPEHGGGQVLTLFHVCFQVYQTALSYYASAYPLLFSDGGKKDSMRDALQGEVGTVNTIMKYAGYAEQQQVYDSNLPFVLDILNTMTKEAKEIEKMNSRIKKR